MSQALYRKWRPARFEEVIGQEHVTRTLQNSVASDRVGHAYLFCGPRGTGKTTSARLLAKAVNCLHEDPAERPCNECSVCLAINDGRFLDLIEIDAASNTGVDDIRDLRDKINFAPNEGRFKVYIIDEVHMLSTAAFNALLKTLEEPPPHAKFVLATTEEHKVPATIKSRCQQFNFRLLVQSEIVDRLAWIAEKEGLAIEPEALQLIARQGAGSIRDAESLLDQLVTAPNDTITLARAQMVLGTASDTAVANLVDKLLDANGADGLAIIQDALASGTDPRQFCRQMVAYLRDLLLMQAAGPGLVVDGTAEQVEKMREQASRARRQLLIDAVKRFNEAAVSPGTSWQPQLPLELAFIELLPTDPLPAFAPAAVPVPQPATPAQTAVSQSKKQKPKPAPQPEPEPEQEQLSPSEPDVADMPRTTPPPKAETAVTAVTLTAVQSRWRELVAIVGQENKNLPPLLAMGKPLATEGSTLILGFDYPIFKEKFDNTAGANQIIAEKLSNLLGQHCTVRAVVSSEYTVKIDKAEIEDLANELGGVVREED
ncbi:MAG: DNA polymerase III subunit gamma/tau [Candidatus Promineifilaceae bacterium]